MLHFFLLLFGLSLSGPPSQTPLLCAEGELVAFKVSSVDQSGFIDDDGTERVVFSFIVKDASSGSSYIFYGNCGPKVALPMLRDAEVEACVMSRDQHSKRVAGQLDLPLDTPRVVRLINRKIDVRGDIHVLEDNINCQ